ncbi:hypothetical protein G7Y89_g330 [Cudoniella acicularis]|uniref:Zn(2)-C6 fungal-type domain-containing protein n=1 Tax=Cudoniella acicularis TaxID=354080 RepID=A0A8H4RXF9_9HELO|nr:hypothetical protein G7Y89_g330 [Cudoniella acicularis]
MEQNEASSEGDAKPVTSPPASAASKSSKKRRKVNHACVYCRRSHMTCDLERPCARCIKRNIGHLCHDEPREPDTATKKSKRQHSNSAAEDDDAAQEQPQSNADGGMSNSIEQPQEPSQDSSLALGSSGLSQGGPLQLVQPSPVSGIQANALNSSSSQFIGYSNDWLGTQNQFQDMHNYHPSYMFNAPEVTNEYNLLNDFLNNSLLDDGALLPEENSNFYTDQSGAMLPGGLNNAGASQTAGLAPPGNPQGNAVSRPASVIPTDKAREYYLQAADPTGNDAPEERMQRLLRAKYDAGMLKPFNYVKGYARLSAYMDGHMHAGSKQKILRQLDRFRPKFREKVQALTDIELIYVEMWFERSLMEYDRVFASMAIPACCWRRTGEIFRGNKEMAELIHVPIEKMRDSFLDYWQFLATGPAFAANLETQLPAAAASRSPGNLLHELEKYISTFPGNLGSAAASSCEEIDSIGTVIWNLCTRLRRKRDLDNPDGAPMILVLARVFAFLMLCCAHDHGKATVDNILRLMRIGIKAAKQCLGSKAWHQKQFDIVEHLYNNSRSSQRTLDQNTAENLADLLYEMGKDLMSSHQYQLAAKWLGRAHETLLNQGIDNLSMDANELRISIIQSYVGAQLRAKEEGGLEKARDLIDTLYNEFGERLIVLLLKLDLITSSADDFDTNSYFDVLQRMIRSIILSEANFKLVMFYIRKLNEKSPTLACKALDELLKLRIIGEGKESLIEKVLITRLWMTRSQGDTLESLALLDKLFSAVIENFNEPLTSAATLAAHTRIESNYSQAQYEIAEKWCRLALHPIFEKSGDVSIARISRKLLLCALARRDLSDARNVFGSMSEAARNETITQFLMFKTAIRFGESETATECLKIISRSTTSDPTYLYGCCLDALEADNKRLILTCLQLVLEKYNYKPPHPVHLPSLLRITIGLTAAFLEESQKAKSHDEVDSLVDKLCKVFEGAVASIQNQGSVHGSEIFWTVSELDWFSKNSYNTAVKHISVWSPRYTLRILTCCIAFINQYPSDMSEQILEDLSLRKMFCEFSAGTALVALARAEDNIENQLQYYLNLRKHVGSFDRLLQDKLDKMDEDPAQDLLQKLSVLLAFDFEAACQLKDWDELGEVLLKAEVCKSFRLYELMADCILCCHPPTEVLINILKKIVNAAWTLEVMDSTKLAKYMRCLFHIAISGDAEIAEQLLDQVYALAEEAKETEQPYPSAELDWIASRAFNHAVDLYCNGQDEGCKTWASKALNIAHFCADDGGLETLLQTRLAGLKFDS